MNGEQMHALMRDLFPIHRSIAGPGIRASIKMLNENFFNPLNIHEIKTGTKVFDWTVPPEWNFTAAYIKERSDIEVWPVYGCEPFYGRISFHELNQHIYTFPKKPDVIPYVTNYYGDGWGIAMRHRDFEKLILGRSYYIHLNCERYPGHLTYADLLIPGELEDEILLTSYICHPQLANNELSGPVVLTALANWIASKPRRYTYRIYIGPETIGAIVYISKHLEHLKSKVKAGWVLTCLGGLGNFYLQHSRNGRTLADRISAHALYDRPFTYEPWKRRRSDERQFCAPGVDLPVCSIRKTNPGMFLGYHTSADDLESVSPEQLQESLDVYKKVIILLEANHRYQAAHLCEPMMSKRGLYPTKGTATSSESVAGLMNVLSMCDGRTMLEIAEALTMPAMDVIAQLEMLEKNELVRRVDE